jgi:hypothetical protein
MVLEHMVADWDLWVSAGEAVELARKAGEEVIRSLV